MENARILDFNEKITMVSRMMEKYNMLDPIAQAHAMGVVEGMSIQKDIDRAKQTA